jgi:hypothetical protein
VPTTDLAVRLYTRPERVLATCFAVASAGSVPLLAALVAWASDPPLLPAMLLRLFVLWTFVPAVGAVAVRWTCRARLRADHDTLVLERRGLRIEVPADAIARIRAWRLPVPEPAVGLWLRSGRRFGWSVAADDPSRVLAALESTSAHEHATAARAAPVVRYATARAAGWRRSAWRLLAKFPVFAFPLGTVFFITHQWITYGGPLGQYHLEGLRPYAATLAVYWTTMTIYLALWAGLWRGVVEMLCLALAWVAPAGTGGVRTMGEWLCRVVYFVGVPAMVALRYLA